MLELETKPLDLASGINAILASVRSLKWEADGTADEPDRSPVQWARDGVCGLATAYLGAWRITVSLAFGVCQRSLWPQKIERWQDGLVAVLPDSKDEADQDQVSWSSLPEGDLDRDWDVWNAVRNLDDDGLRDLQTVIEESVRYLLDAGELQRAEIAAFDAAISALHADVCRWTQNASTEPDLCRVVHALAMR